jgi:hypothetical protein
MENRYKIHTIFYGFGYLSLIPIFGIIYYSLPEGYISYSNGDIKFLNSFYFSIITVTTLGYGDILPIHDIAKVLVGLQSFLGVLFIGLFLHSLSLKHTRDLEILDEKKKMSARISSCHDIALFLSKIICFWRMIYVDLVEKGIVTDKKNFKKIEDLFNLEFMSMLINNLNLESEARVYPKGQLWIDYIHTDIRETLDLGSIILNRYPAIVDYKIYQAVHELTQGRPGFYYLKQMLEIKEWYQFNKRVSKKPYSYLRSYFFFENTEDLNPFINLYYLCVEEQKYVKKYNPDIYILDMEKYIQKIYRFSDIK